MPVHRRIMSLFDTDNAPITPITAKGKAKVPKKFLSSAFAKIYEKPEDPEKISVRSCFDSGVFVQILQSNIRRQKRHIQRALILTLQHSVSHCYITSPYFLPPHKLKQAMISAAQNHVDVRIITAVSYRIKKITL